MNKKTIINLVVTLIVIAFIFNAGQIGRWAFVAIVSYIAVRLAIYAARYYKKYRKNLWVSRKERLLKVLACLMGVFFISGTVIYVFTFPIIGHDHHVEFNNAELILRSMISSLDMFMLDVDSNILDRLDPHPLLKGLIISQAAISFLCTVTLLISLIYSRAKAYYDLHRRTKITNEKSHLYLFFGLNDHTKLLARDIHENDEKAVIVCVDQSMIEEDENDSWSNIVSLFTHRQKTFDLADDSKALVDISSSRLCDLDGQSLDGADTDVFAMIGLEKIRDLISDLQAYPAESQLHVFFLSDDEDANISSLLTIAKDRTLLSLSSSDKEEKERIIPRIYCHARYNGPNRIVEDLAVRKKLIVEIVDTSHLAVELIKSTPEDQPVRAAKLSSSHPTMVESPLKCLIAGFGEVGRDAFRFLYEFGTFMQMKEGIPVEVNPYITAVDSNMKNIEGLFKVHKPALKFNSEDGPLSLLNIDWHEEAFFTKCLTPEKCCELNYIVIALGDDDQNMALASTLFQLIRRYREDMSHLLIMVRCVKQEKLEMMRKVAAHYNNGGADGEIIRLFGNPKEIYSYHTIIKDELTKRGQAFFSNYEILRKGNGNWHIRREKLTAPLNTQDGADDYPGLDNLRKLRRQESQDLANALHASTKTWLLRQALPKQDWSDLCSRLFDPQGGSTMEGGYADIRYPGLTEEENTIMLRLAMLEHARWNAAHMLLGYIPDDKKIHSSDERTQVHNCIKQWGELDEESAKASSSNFTYDYKSYDFSVVETSIALEENMEDNTNK